MHDAVDVLLPLRDAWLNEHPEHRRCLRCGDPFFAHIDAFVCMGSVYAPCRVRCGKHVDSWLNDTPSKHIRPQGEWI